mgnify:CR=1 FL=1|jgi:hypothetical protein
MRGFMIAFTACVVMALAFWAYRENYETQQALQTNNTLQRDLGAARERLSVLRAEWAYLNRPERLRDLADLNFERLGLLPLQPEQFGRVGQVSFPPRISLINNPVDVMGLTEDEGADQ